MMMMRVYPKSSWLIREKSRYALFLCCNSPQGVHPTPTRQSSCWRIVLQTSSSIPVRVYPVTNQRLVSRILFQPRSRNCCESPLFCGGECNLYVGCVKQMNVIVSSSLGFFVTSYAFMLFESVVMRRKRRNFKVVIRHTSSFIACVDTNL